MKMHKFQEAAMKTATYHERQKKNMAVSEIGMIELMYAGLGLSGEAGEVADEIKKLYRDGEGFTEKRMNNLFEELGDVLWYVAACCNELGFDMEDVAEANIKKLKERYDGVA
jgi:NTP pyrophosphatase (non-canonical NTP hydrolase)